MLCTSCLLGFGCHDKRGMISVVQVLCCYESEVITVVQVLCCDTNEVIGVAQVVLLCRLRW
jgi:hypothetical protein